MNALPNDTFFYVPRHLDSKPLKSKVQTFEHAYYAYILRESLAKQHTLPLFAYADPQNFLSIGKYLTELDALVATCAQFHIALPDSTERHIESALHNMFTLESNVRRYLIQYALTQHPLFLMPDVGQSPLATKRQRRWQLLRKPQCWLSDHPDDQHIVFKMHCLQQLAQQYALTAGHRTQLQPAPHCAPLSQDATEYHKSKKLPLLTFSSREHVERAWVQLKTKPEQFIEHLNAIYDIPMFEDHFVRNPNEKATAHAIPAAQHVLAIAAQLRML